MEDKGQLKRRVINLGIKTKLQLKYLKLIIGIIVAVMVIIVLTFYATFHLTLSTAQLGRYAEARLSEVFSWLNWLLLIECVIFTIIAGIMSLKLTHKVAGPLYRMEKLVKAMAEKGQAEEIRIRKNDELHGLASALNELMRKISTK